MVKYFLYLTRQRTTLFRFFYRKPWLINFRDTYVVHSISFQTFFFVQAYKIGVDS